MAETLRLDIVTPYGSIFSEDVLEVTATGTEGEFGVMPGHASFITTLKAGKLSCKTEEGVSHFFVSWGYAEVGAEKVQILADGAEKSDDIDVVRAHDAKKRAEDELKHEDEMKFKQAEASLERALCRINIAEEYGKK